MIAGSTRLKAGTATKLALNTISTTLMIRSGRIHQNLMIDLKATNDKISKGRADEVKKYRAEGETLHKAGKHQESVDTLAKAMKILDVK